MFKVFKYLERKMGCGCGCVCVWGGGEGGEGESITGYVYIVHYNHAFQHKEYQVTVQGQQQKSFTHKQDAVLLLQRFYVWMSWYVCLCIYSYAERLMCVDRCVQCVCVCVCVWNVLLLLYWSDFIKCTHDVNQFCRIYFHTMPSSLFPLLLCCCLKLASVIHYLAF